MADVGVLAREWIVTVNSQVVGGLSEITFGATSKEADFTTNDSAGAEEHQISRRSRTVKLKGLFLEDAGTKGRDDGQAAVETLAEGIGLSSLAEVIITSPAGTTWTFQASATMDDLAGPGDEGTTWGATLKSSGAIAVS